MSEIGPYRSETLAVVGRDARGTLLGGIQGRVLFGWRYIELWVAEEHRGQGLGGSLLERIETAAIEKGANRVALLTIWRTQRRLRWAGS